MCTFSFPPTSFEFSTKAHNSVAHVYSFPRFFPQKMGRKDWSRPGVPCEQVKVSIVPSDSLVRISPNKTLKKMVNPETKRKGTI